MLWFFRVIVGAPLGKFPGGISGIEIDSLACATYLDAIGEVITEERLNATTQEERMNCLANFTSPGLVYQCNLNEEDCRALLGNGNARSPDGYLFDRIGL